MSSSPSSSKKRTKLLAVYVKREEEVPVKRIDITKDLKKSAEHIRMYQLLNLKKTESRNHLNMYPRILTRKELVQSKKPMILAEAEMLMSETIVPETDPENKKIAMRYYDLLMKFGSEEDNTLPEECMCQLEEFFDSSS